MLNHNDSANNASAPNIHILCLIAACLRKPAHNASAAVHAVYRPSGCSYQAADTHIIIACVSIGKVQNNIVDCSALLNVHVAGTRQSAN